jgi:hypothetical protein
MSASLLIVPQALGTFLVADLVTGIVHWLEDVYADESMPFIGRHVARTNIVHHHFPRHFTHLTWWQSSWLLCVLSALILLAAWGLGLLTWHVWLFAGLSANANQIHKWAHQTRAENGPVVSCLQHIRLLQTPRHHARHHTDPKDCHYCTMSNLLNPVLDRINFWSGLEVLFTRITGLRRRRDTSVAGQGPGPAWLDEYRPRHATPGTGGTCHRSQASPADYRHRTAATVCATGSRECSTCHRTTRRSTAAKP